MRGEVGLHKRLDIEIDTILPSQGARNELDLELGFDLGEVGLEGIGEERYLAHLRCLVIGALLGENLIGMHAEEAAYLEHIELLGCQQFEVFRREGKLIEAHLAGKIEDILARCELFFHDCAESDSATALAGHESPHQATAFEGINILPIRI